MTDRLPTQTELVAMYRYDMVTGKLYHKRRGMRRPEVGCVWSVKRNCSDYLVTTIHGKDFKLHRVIWKLVYGDEPPMIDHLNGDGTDNRLENLRHSNYTHNGHNRRDNSEHRQPGRITLPDGRRVYTEAGRREKRIRDEQYRRNKGVKPRVSKTL